MYIIEVFLKITLSYSVIINGACVIIIGALVIWQNAASNNEPLSRFSEIEKENFLRKKKKNILCISILIFVFTVLQGLHSEYQKEIDAEKLKAVQDSRDSIIMKNTEKNADTLFNKISRALGKEGYKIDLLKEELYRSKPTETPGIDATVARSEIEAMRYPLDRLDAKFTFKKTGKINDLSLATINIYILDSTSEKTTKEIYSLDKLNSWDLAKDGIKNEYQALYQSSNLMEDEIYEAGNYYVVNKKNVLYRSWSPNRKIKSFKDLSKAGIIVTIWPHDSAIVPQNIIFNIPTKDQKASLQFCVLTNPKYSAPIYIYKGYIKPGQVEIALGEF